MHAVDEAPPVATVERDEKAWATLQAQFALKGHTLHRTNPKDGPVSFYAERWGMVRYLPTPADVRRFLEQLGGTA